MKLSPFNNTFGMPPASHVSDTEIINSMPVMEITPCTPHFESGLTLFRVNEAWDKYNGILNSLGYQLDTQPIRLAFIADNFPTDSFTNEYGETFLQKFTDVASSGMQQLAQMTGNTSGLGTLDTLGGTFQTTGQEMGGALGGIVEGIGSGAAGTAAALRTLKSSMSGNKVLGGAAQMIDKMIGGHRVDFPQIWRNSGYTPSYTATVRLYNPNPASSSSTQRHIIGPLAVILALAIPRSEDGKTFNWPFFHKIYSRGIYGLDPAVITNVTVIKGGDQQQVAFNQQLAMVDVRIDITSLYGTMVLEENKTFESARPTVNNYLDHLLENDSTLSYTRNEMRHRAGISAAVGAQGEGILVSSDRFRTDAATLEADQSFIAKNEAVRRRNAPKVLEKIVTDRVQSDTAALAAALRSQSPTDLFT